MRNYLRRAVGLGVTLLVGALLSTAERPGQSSDESMTLVGRSSGIPFLIAGSRITNLYPGAVRPLRITIINPNGFALTLRTVSGRVTRSSRSGCTVSKANILIKNYNGTLPIVIAPHSHRQLAGSLPVVMPPGAARRCAGSRFAIDLDGLAWRAQR